jgi:hypothetical protein
MWGELATFTHSVQTQANAVKFSHQLLCNPKISSNVKALRKVFLQGCPNLNQELVAKYLYPNPATAKGHMKQPKKGIKSMGKAAAKKGDVINNVPTLVPQVAPPVLPVFIEPPPYHRPAYGAQHEANLILDNNSIANVFCFGAFTDKISGVVYNKLTGNFPFMSIKGSVCFFVMYHYKAKAILVKA